METPNTDKTARYAQDIYSESSSAEYPVPRRGPPPIMRAEGWVDWSRFTARHGIAALIAVFVLLMLGSTLTFILWSGQKERDEQSKERQEQFRERAEQTKEEQSFHEKVVVELTLIRKTMEDMQRVEAMRLGSTAVYVGEQPRGPAATPLPKHRSSR